MYRMFRESQLLSTDSSRADAAALQSPGLQHVYGNSWFADPVVRVAPMRSTDHDALVVTARLRR